MIHRVIPEQHQLVFGRLHLVEMLFDKSPIEILNRHFIATI